VVQCSTCGGGHIAGNRECEHYKQAMRVQQFREINKGVSYAKAARLQHEVKWLTQEGEKRKALHRQLM